MRPIRYSIYYSYTINPDKKTATYEYVIHNDKDVPIYQGSFVRSSVRMDFKRGWHYRRNALHACACQAAKRHEIGLHWFREVVYISETSAKLNVSLRESELMYHRAKQNESCYQLKLSSLSYAERVSMLQGSTKKQPRKRKTNIFLDYNDYLPM